MRGDWQLRDVTLCLTHRHLLVPLWRADARVARFDFAARFDAILDDLVAGALDRPLCEPSDFDRWLDHRLETGEDPTALAAYGLYPAVSFCRLLGRELLRSQGLPETEDVLTLRASQQAGFAVARRGEAAIAAALMDLVAAGGASAMSPKASSATCSPSCAATPSTIRPSPRSAACCATAFSRSGRLRRARRCWARGSPHAACIRGTAPRARSV